LVAEFKKSCNLEELQPMDEYITQLKHPKCVVIMLRFMYLLDPAEGVVELESVELGHRAVAADSIADTC